MGLMDQISKVLSMKFGFATEVYNDIAMKIWCDQIVDTDCLWMARR